MRLDDLTLEVRDRTLARVGQITKPFLNLKATVRWCAVGEWTLTLPGDHAMVSHLVEDGSGIILLGPDGESTGVIFSGPTTTPARKRDAKNPDGTYTFHGVTDEIHLLDALAFPSPNVADPTAQTRANDVRTAKTEALLRQFVAYNVANGAIAETPTTWAPAGRLRGARARIRLAGEDQDRGTLATKSPRFQNLLELLQEIVTLDASIGFRMVQVGQYIEFVVLDSRDRRGLVRFDVENGTLTSEEVQQSGPGLTYAIVAGQGEGTERQIVARTTPEATAAEDTFGRVIESFIDQRDTDETVELQQSGDEALHAAAGGTSVKIIPADESTMQFGLDWRPGDLVTIVVDGQEMPSSVTETALLVNADGVRAGAALGDVSSFTSSDTIGSKVDAIDARVSNLERSTSGAGALTGEIKAWPMNAAPDGYYICDGSLKNRVTDAALFGIIGTTFGAGDGSTTFALPNLKGRTIVGRDAAQAEFDTLGEMGGSKTNTLANTQLPPHFHRLGDNYGGNIGYSEGSAGARTMYTTGYGLTRTSPANDLKTGIQDTTTGQPVNNLQPYMALNYIIKR